MSSPERRVGDRPFLVDAAAVGLISLFICLWSERLALMSVLVPVVLLARLGLWLALPRAERDLGGRAEVAFFLMATLFGAFNDWNSVTRHRVYDYTVPTDLPGLSHIPIWMLLYWGLILRFVLTVFHWRRSGLGRAGDGVWLGRRTSARPLLKVLLLLGLVLATRQAIYRLYDHVLWSWLPFAVAILAYLALFRPERARLRLLVLVVAIGPAVEALYIQVGHLHAYRLGWLGGVPLWIALWWGLAALVWDDIGTRLMDGLERALGSKRALSSAPS
ncbi:MAG: DUF2878 family protein [Polyangiaceae bacterium]|nr:DUF2878 family protein [Polyangiaceae bacterium]MCE7894183.1 DUF2878 family protein [Sorangiineae bacterium PRO1]MCL4749312.1 DUF2878 family protein [Myxococcales bacterium]